MVFRSKIQEYTLNPDSKIRSFKELREQELRADKVAIIVTNRQRNKIAVKKRDGGKIAIPSGQEVLHDPRFGGNIRLAAIAEALHDLGWKDMEYLFDEQHISLVGIYQVTKPNLKKSLTIPLYEFIIPEKIAFAFSSDKSTEMAFWLELDRLPSDKSAFAFEHADFLKEWQKKRQYLIMQPEH